MKYLSLRRPIVQIVTRLPKSNRAHCEGDFSLFVQGKSNMAARSYRILWSIINGGESMLLVGMALSLNGNRNEQYADSIKTTSICALNWDINTPHRNSTCWIPYI